MREAEFELFFLFYEGAELREVKLGAQGHWSWNLSQGSMSVGPTLWSATSGACGLAYMGVP